MTRKRKDANGLPRRATAERRAGSAFTLIELLVVLAVVSLLVAILLPSLGRARASARLVRCGANLRQLATAWIAYLDDHNGRFYQRPNANVNYGGWRGLQNEKGWWPRPLNPWVGLPDPDGVTERTAKVFCCPSDRGGIPGWFYLEKAYRTNGTSYQTNIFLVGPDSCKPFSACTAELDLEIAKRLPNLNLNQVANHSLMILIGDYGWVNQWNPTPLPEVEWKEQAEWHGRTDHHDVAFLDGHVEYTEIRQGFYVTSEYRVLPFAVLDELAGKVQGPCQ
ncbi:MAG: prepilin-type N-terminal cleavage/methylation domain-containing protein [Sedimentisphaerales bacterium]|nr:prepilin-type N-terminal cleavage/methylation domain-containing protein [Sedimentisphaerales bacterium]